MSEGGQGNDDVGSGSGLPHAAPGPAAAPAGRAADDRLDRVLPAHCESGPARRFVPSFVRLVADEF